MLVRRSLLPSSLNQAESALASALLVCTEISRNSPPVSPSESALTNNAPVKSLESALTKKVGGLPCLAPAPTRSFLHERSSVSSVFSERCALFPSQQGGGVCPHPFPFRNSALTPAPPERSPNAATTQLSGTSARHLARRRCFQCAGTTGRSMKLASPAAWYTRCVAFT